MAEATAAAAPAPMPPIIVRMPAVLERGVRRDILRVPNTINEMAIATSAADGMTRRNAAKDMPQE